MKHLLLERVAYALLLKSYSAGEPGCGWERGSIGCRVTMGDWGDSSRTEEGNSNRAAPGVSVCWALPRERGVAPEAFRHRFDPFSICG